MYAFLTSVPGVYLLTIFFQAKFTHLKAAYASLRLEITHRKELRKNDGLESWRTIHKSTGHGLAISLDTKRVKIIQQLQTVSNIELLPEVLEIDDKIFLLVLI